MEDTVGLEFLSKLEALLIQISNGDLKGTMVDAQGLDALKMLLVKAGFDPDEVKGVIAELKEKSKSESLNLEDVFASLSELVVEVDEKANPEVVYMETSALPFLKEMLGGLGLSDEQVDAMIQEADQGSNGISLEAIIENLKTLEAAYREGGKALTIENADGSFKTLMTQLNLPVSDKKHETFSINDLIKAFEAYKASKQASQNIQNISEPVASVNSDADSSVLSSVPLGKEAVGKLLNSFFASLSQTTETETASFSYQQIKDQFVNEMMIPENNDGGKKVLFASGDISSDAKTEQLVKELVSLVSDKNGASSGKKAGPAETSGKELNRELTKAEAVLQAGNTSGSDIDSSGTSSRAKATPRTLPAYVTQQVGRGIARAVNRGENTLTLQLKPAELGRLTMTIDHQSTGIKVSIVTENQSARDLLASNVNELKSALGSAGISLDSFDVDMNSDFRQSMANAGNQAGQFGKKNGNGQGSKFSGQGNGTEDDIPISTGELVTDGSYHFVA